MAESLLLKWGTLKGWELEKDETKDILKRYYALGVSANGPMVQHDNPEQKAIICELIDAVDEIQNDWSGEMMTKDEAKKYVMKY